MPTQRKNWTRDETLLAFGLYCRVPFGQLHQHNPEVKRLAAALGRTPSAVGMKACNFASLDSAHQDRGVSGLANRSALVEQIWAEFQQESAAIADEIETLNDRIANYGETEVVESPAGPSERLALVKARRVQSFFRRAVLTSYGHRCALTGLSEPAMLNASHILPWHAAESERANPANGLCLNALHDRAFDRGLITFDPDLRVVLSPRISDFTTLGTMADTFRAVEGERLALPTRFLPSARFLEHHRTVIYIAA